jgi:hypothetical protein
MLSGHRPPETDRDFLTDADADLPVIVKNGSLLQKRALIPDPVSADAGGLPKMR